ncbi:MAG: hypothetical protein ACE5E8_02545 [Acidimicrobiia bacterium]
MRRLESRLFRINDRLSELVEEARLAGAELEMLRHIDDDARRDAAVTDNPLDRDDARETARDVARFEKVLADIADERDELEAKRDRLLGKL